MGIHQLDNAMHWNYFLSIEDDIAELARWVEFNPLNYGCYSIEMAKLLMTCSAEVDVIAKLLCKTFCNSPQAKSINKYQEVLCEEFPTLTTAEITIPRYSITMHPWENWAEANNPPLWWTSNNKVKHQRSDQFMQANLKNVLNSAAALLHLLEIYYGLTINRLPSLPKLFKPNLSFGYPDNAGMILVPRRKIVKNE